MSRHRLLIGVMASVLALGLGQAWAVGVKPPPIGPPPPTRGPQLELLPEVVYPFDFHFVDHVYGWGFKANEQVRVSLEHVSAAPVMITAAKDGSFTSALSFNWVFCGPSAGTSSPPLAVATGSAGSRAQAAFTALPCPSLAVPPIVVKPLSPPVAGPGVTVPGPSTSPPKSEPTPFPNPILPAPFLRPLHVTGFGFAVGEIVRVTVIGLPGSSSPAMVSADAYGRISASVRAPVFPACSGAVERIWLIATGSRGTTAAYPFGFGRLQSLPCPVRTSPGTGTVAPDNPPSPSPASVGAAAVGIHLQSSSVRRGGTEQARVIVPAATTITLSVRYAGGWHQSLIRRAAAGPATLRWSVPARAGVGKAQLSVRLAAPPLTLNQSFSVRK